MQRTHAQIPVDEQLPPAISGRTYVTLVTDPQDEPSREETPEGYKEVSYIAIEVPKETWEAVRASLDDVSLAQAQATTDAFEASLEVIMGGGV